MHPWRNNFLIVATAIVVAPVIKRIILAVKNAGKPATHTAWVPVEQVHRAAQAQARRTPQMKVGGVRR